jgi:hypothetical protein
MSQSINNAKVTGQGRPANWTLVQFGAAKEARLLTLYRALPRLLRHVILTVVEQSYTRTRR